MGSRSLRSSAGQQGLSRLQLHHIAQRSQRSNRATSLAYWPVSATSVAILASNYGAARHPVWYHNPIAHPTAVVEIDGDRWTVVVRDHASCGAAPSSSIASHTPATPSLPLSAEPRARFPSLSSSSEHHVAIANLDDFAALEPFFQVIKEGLGDLVDDVHFFDILSKDVVVDYVITVPGYPRRVKGREAVAELYRPYGDLIELDRCFDLRGSPRPDDGNGRPRVHVQKAERSKPAVRMRTATFSVLTISDRQVTPLARLPRPARSLRRTRVARD